MRILFLGDSITAGCNAGSEQLGFVNLLNQMTGFECLNFGVGGTRIAPTQGEPIGPEYEEYFLKRAKRMPEADLVFVFGGTNDFGHGDAPLGEVNDKSENTFSGALNTLYDYLITRYKKECVKVILPISRFDEKSTRGEFFKAKKEGSPTLKTYKERIDVIAKNYGLEVLDFNDNFGEFLSERSDSNIYYCYDGIHPNYLGHQLLANLLLEYLKSNGFTHYDNLTTIGEVKVDESFYPYAKYFFYEWGKETDEIRVSDQHKFVLDNLNRLYEMFKNKLTDFVYPDKEDENVNFMHLKHNDKRKCALVLAGGALWTVCSAIESIPIGLRLFDLGYDVFIVNYKVQKDALYGRSVDDIATVARYLLEHQNELNIDMNDYAVIGSSAAGYIVSQFGTNNHGYKKYNLPKPGLIGLQYPVISMIDKDSHSFTRQMVLGEGDVDSELEQEYSTHLHVDETYPKCFVTRASYEGLVNPLNSDLLVNELKKHNVPVRYDIRPGIGHGWGIGTHLVFEGWVDNMVSFWKK